MKAPQFKNHYNNVPYKGDICQGASETIQGETSTIRQLFERAAIQGHFPLEDNKAPYLDVDNIEHINHMYAAGVDLVDLQEHKVHLENLATEVDKAILEHNSKEALKLSTSDTIQSKTDKAPIKSENVVKAPKTEQKTEKD